MPITDTLSLGSVSRRTFIKSSFALAVVGSSDHGFVKPPLPVPDIKVVRQDGVADSLIALTAHHVTALQLMFTHCTTTCPMEGAIFERVQKRLPDMSTQGIQLVSLSVDPKNDTPQALTEWMGHFHAGPAWIGAAPATKDLDAVRSFFGVGSNLLDPHSTQVHIIDRSSRVVWRTYELPAPEDIASILRKV